ncbi:MAG: hypothetical protein CMJ64_16870 [Planctomycetaceae bacterium]|nr:hypothetical protein [Planctomycetaceae bacterium]
MTKLTRAPTERLADWWTARAGPGIRRTKAILISAAVATTRRSNAGSYARIGRSATIASTTVDTRAKQWRRLNVVHMHNNPTAAMQNVIASDNTRASAAPAFGQDMKALFNQESAGFGFCLK